MISEFGVIHDFDYDEIAKAEQQRSRGSASAGRMAAASFGAPVHGLVAGRKGRKLAAGGSQLGAGVGGAAVGRIAGGILTRGRPGGVALGGLTGGTGGVLGATEVGNRRGWYKREKH